MQNEGKTPCHALVFRDALDDMRRIELGERTEAFQKALPKTMTADEKGRATNEFVFEQIEILGITEW